MPKLPRYYVTQSGDGKWLVCDRNRTRMHNDIVETCRTREHARAVMQKLNKDEREDRHVDTQTGAGETI